MNPASDKFFNNPAFREYIFLLAELHRLIREGRDETPEGWAINDAMDGPGAQLSAEEVEAVGLLAADFYNLGERHRSILDTSRVMQSMPEEMVGTDQPLEDRPIRQRAPNQTDNPRELIP
jgi:hypothetical protein